jgi:hypothetical protein
MFMKSAASAFMSSAFGLIDLSDIVRATGVVCVRARGGDGRAGAPDSADRRDGRHCGEMFDYFPAAGDDDDETVIGSHIDDGGVGMDERIHY